MDFKIHKITKFIETAKYRIHKIFLLEILGYMLAMCSCIPQQYNGTYPLISNIMHNMHAYKRKNYIVSEIHHTLATYTSVSKQKCDWAWENRPSRRKLGFPEIMNLNILTVITFLCLVVAT